MKFIKYEPHQNLSPGTVTVTVVCNAESHSGRVATLGVFTWKDDYRVWALYPHRSVKGPVLEWGLQTLRGDTLGEPTMPSRARLTPSIPEAVSDSRASCARTGSLGATRNWRRSLTHWPNTPMRGKLSYRHYVLGSVAVSRVGA